MTDPTRNAEVGSRNAERNSASRFRIPHSAFLLLLAACQPQARRLLLLDLQLSDPLALDATAEPWRAAGYTVEYRRFFPHLTRSDLGRYHTLVLLGGDDSSNAEAITVGDLALLDEWVGGGGVAVLGYGEGGGGTAYRWTVNRWLVWQGAHINIGDLPLPDSLAPTLGAVDPQP